MTRSAAYTDASGVRGRLMWVGAAFLLALAGVLVFFVRGGPAALETGDKIGSVGSLLFGAASLAVALVTLRQARQAPDDDPGVLLDQAAEELARLVVLQRAGASEPAPDDPALRAQLEVLRDRRSPGAQLGGIAAALGAWTQLHGLVALEIHGQLAPVIGDGANLFHHCVERQVHELGLHPTP